MNEARLITGLRAVTLTWICSAWTACAC